MTYQERRVEAAYEALRDTPGSSSREIIAEMLAAADAVLPDGVESALHFAKNIGAWNNKTAIQLIEARDAAIAKTVPDDVIEVLEFYRNATHEQIKDDRVYHLDKWAFKGGRADYVLTKYRPQDKP